MTNPIQTTLSLSYAHLPKDMADLPCSEWGGIWYALSTTCVQDYTSMHILIVDQIGGQSAFLPDWLKGIHAYAFEMGCMLIAFSCDGAIEPLLPIHNPSFVSGSILRQQMADLGYDGLAAELEEDEAWWKSTGYAYQSSGSQKSDILEYFHEYWGGTTNYGKMLGLLITYFDIFMETSCTDEAS